MSPTMFTLKLCTFCYKSVPHELHYQTNKIDKFITLMKRFVGENPLKILHASVISGLLVYCKDCEYLVNEFCEFYNKIKCLELQLLLKLKTLEAIMKMADCVPSRVKLVKQYFEEEQLLQEQSQSDDGKENGILNVNGQNKLTSFKSTRLKILRTCQKCQASSIFQPRVILQRLQEDLLPSSSSNYESSPITSVMDATEVQSVLNSDDDVEDSEQISEDLLDRPCTQNYPLNVVSEESIEEGSTHKYEDDQISGKNIMNGITRSNEVDTDTISERSSSNKSKKSILKAAFTCSRCSKKFVHEKRLKNHKCTRIFKVKLDNVPKSGKTRKTFHCSLCNISYTTYSTLRTHKRTVTHQILFRRNLKMRRLVKKENSLEPFPKECDEPKIKNESQQDSRHAVSCDEDTNSLEDSELSFTENGESSSDSEYSSSSSHDESEIQDKNESPRKYYHCHLEECQLKQVQFNRKIYFDEHKKLHKRGKFSCQFCDKVESTAIKLSLHECEMHSALESSSTSSKKGEAIYNCARCPFDTKMEGVYFKHFASVHLGIYNAKLGRDLKECEICKRRLLQREDLIERHFKTHHDTNGLEDPEKRIKKCEQDGCTAYFLTTTQLKFHETNQHSLLTRNGPLVAEESDEEEDIGTEEINNPKCKFCEKTFPSFTFLARHKHKFHMKGLSANFSNLKTEFPDKIYNYNRKLVCPEITCTKSFQTQIGLETHAKLHGKFACNFCDHVADYAIELAYHENKMHTTPFKGKPVKSLRHRKTKCSRCPKILKNQTFYENHFVNVHLGLSTTCKVCQICKFSSNSEYNLNSHNISNHFIEGMDPSEVSRCDQCSAYFRLQIQLFRHKLKVHQNDSKCKVKCKKCNREFRSDKGLKNHVSKIHNNMQSQNELGPPFDCLLDNCQQKFSNKFFLDRHQKLHEQGEYSCQFCDVVCDTVLQLITHETTTHSSGNTKLKGFKCSRCSLNYFKGAAFQNHFAQVHLKLSENEGQMPGNFECKICKLQLSYGSDLAIHEAQHNKSTGFQFKCPRCPNIVRNDVYVAHFLQKHLGRSKRKGCSICKIQTVRLTAHYKNCHKVDKSSTSQLYKCEGYDKSCKAYFIKPEQLFQHQRKMHGNDSEWNCKECGKKLKSERTLKSHMKIVHPNSDENPALPFACDIVNCKKRFATKAESDYHQKSHKKRVSSSNFDAGKERLSKFKCEKCDKEFAHKNNLQSHLSNVHSEKSFICPECGKVFKLKSALNLHLEYHKGPDAWKFQCPTCGKKCATKGHLAMHMRTHTKDVSWVCQYCGNKYAHQHNWKNHILAKHGDEADAPNKMKFDVVNRLSRKGTKKGECVLARV